MTKSGERFSKWTITFGGLALFFAVAPPMSWWAGAIAGLLWALIGINVTAILRRYL